VTTRRVTTSMGNGHHTSGANGHAHATDETSEKTETTTASTSTTPSSPSPQPKPAPPLNAAADLIKTLDSAFAEMSSLSASAAKDAEEARRNARAASEVARRYTSRSYPKTPFGSSTSPKMARKPMSSPPKQSPRSTPGSGSPRKRKIKPPVNSSERLAQAHAEDVLSLSLELERAKQELENERMAHDQTKSKMTEHKTKQLQMQTQNQKLLTDMESQQQEHEVELDKMHGELERANVRVAAAEEDANLALELAKSNAHSREQLETWLQKALEEIEVLRAQPQLQQPKRVNFAESPTIVTIPHRDDSKLTPVAPPAGVSRSMVAAGRNLLHKAGTPVPAAPTTKNSTDKHVHTISLSPASKSAERRQQLRERLRSLDEPASSQFKPPPSPGNVHGMDLTLATKAVESVNAVARVMKESSKKVGLVSANLATTNNSNGNAASAEEVAVLARQYCSAMEAKLSRQSDEIKELESLCDYLEEKLVVRDRTKAAKNADASER